MEPDIAVWDSGPLDAFERFLRSEAFVATGRERKSGFERRFVQEDTAKVYLSMFRQFAKWLKARGQPFSQLGAGDILDFYLVVRRSASSSLSMRYIRMLERCYIHLKINNPNPAAAALGLAKKAVEKPKDKDSTVLSTADVDQFAQATPVHNVRYRRNAPNAGWKRRRDQAMQIVLAYAGLRVSEVIGLTIGEVGTEIRYDGQLPITVTPEGKNSTSEEHVALLRPEGVPILQAWVAERRRLPIAGDLLFPAPDGTALAKTTLYRQVNATFKRAGIEAGRTGGRTLRNSYAVDAIGKGVPHFELRDILGLAEVESAALYSKKKVSK